MRFRPSLPLVFATGTFLWAGIALLHQGATAMPGPSADRPLTAVDVPIGVNPHSLLPAMEPLGPDPASGTALLTSSLPALDIAPVPLLGSFALNVPFRTQKDGARFQGANCGPASLSMVLNAFGVDQTNSDLRWLVQGYMGNQGRGGGTALHDVASVGRDFGLSPIGLYDGDDFAQWTPDDVEEQIRLGHPVIALVKYRLLPTHLGATIGYDHYVVIYGMEGDKFLYHDPAYESELDGSANIISRGQLSTAMKSSSIPGQAVAFAPGKLVVLAARSL